MLRRAHFVRSIIATTALLLLVASTVWAGAGKSGYWAGHGNHKFSPKSLTVGQARRAIAAAIAKQQGRLGGMRINPSDVKVTLRLAADGKTAVWRAEAKPRAGKSALRKLLSWGRSQGSVSTELKGTIDISLRAPDRKQIATRAYEISRGNALSDWKQAEATLGRFGSTPRKSSIRRLAAELSRQRSAGRDAHWLTAEKELKLDLFGGSRVTISDSAFRQTTKQLFPTQ